MAIRTLTSGAALAGDRAPKERARRVPTVAWVRQGGSDEPGSVLARHGWVVRPVSAEACAAGAVPDVDVVLAEVSERADAVLLTLESLRAAGGAELAFLCGSETEAQARWMAALTPYCWRAPVTEETLAILLEGVLARGLVEASIPARSVAIRLWESVEVDGMAVYLGSAERNFLFTLAARPGARLSKLDDVDAGGGRSVAAIECRRRLGRRLSPELADLLVPAERGEPYRFREPEEVEAICRLGRAHRATCLRVIGRASVRTVSGLRLEAFA